MIDQGVAVTPSIFLGSKGRGIYEKLGLQYIIYGGSAQGQALHFCG